MAELNHNAYSRQVRWLFFCLIVLTVALSWSGVIDHYTTTYIDEALVQASSAFVIARGMNALISFLQSVTFEFSFGIGGSIGAGQVLDPLNDLVEQYSSAMKLAIGSLVIQKVLLEIVSDTFFKVLLSLSALAVLLSSVLAQFVVKLQIKHLLLKIFFLLVFLRFSLVIVVAANGLVDNAFLHDRTENQMQILENIEGVSEHSNPQLDPALNQALTNNIAELQHQAELLQQDLSQRSQRQQQGQQELQQREQQLQNLVRELGALQRLNYLNPDPRVQTMNEQIKQRRAMLQSWQAEHKSLQRQLTETVNQIQLAELALEGKTPGFMAAISNSFSSLGDGIAAIKEAVNPRQVYQLKQRLDNAVNNILNLMALFLLKTLILPLLFLFILNKGFKLIWRSDPLMVLQPVSR